MTDETKAYYEAQIEKLVSVMEPIRDGLIESGEPIDEVKARVEQIMTGTLVRSHLGMSAEEAGRQIIRKAAFVGGPAMRRLFPEKEAS